LPESLECNIIGLSLEGIDPPDQHQSFSMSKKPFREWAQQRNIHGQTTNQ
jgi:hypothetical protein